MNLIIVYLEKEKEMVRVLNWNFSYARIWKARLNKKKNGKLDFSNSTMVLL